MIYVGWATKTAIETLQKLHELDKAETLSSEFINNIEDETNNSTESRGSIDDIKSEDVTTCIKMFEIDVVPKEDNASVEEENEK